MLLYNAKRSTGIALMIAALIFVLTKLRHVVDADDSLLGYFMTIDFALWLAGLAGFYLHYRARAGWLGKGGIIVSILGVASLTAGHFGEFVLHTDFFAFIILGSLALALGPLLFGIAVLRRAVLPRQWRYLPLVTGVIGIAWPLISNPEGSRLRFLFFRTLFGLGWLLLGYVLYSDQSETVGRSRLIGRFRAGFEERA